MFFSIFSIRMAFDLRTYPLIFVSLSWFSYSCFSKMSFVIIPPPQNVGGGGLYWIRFDASVGWSVGRSVRPSPIRVHCITPLLMEGFPSNLNDPFTSTSGCAEPMLPMCQLKVKVTVKGQIFNKYYTLCRVRSITPLLMEGFPSNLNDAFTSTRGCAEPMLPMCQLKVKVTVKCQILNKKILDMSCPLFKPYTNGRISLDVQSPCCPCVSSRSRSQLKVKC